MGVGWHPKSKKKFASIIAKFLNFYYLPELLLSFNCLTLEFQRLCQIEISAILDFLRKTLKSLYNKKQQMEETKAYIQVSCFLNLHFYAFTFFSYEHTFSKWCLTLNVTHILIKAEKLHFTMTFALSFLFTIHNRLNWHGRLKVLKLRKKLRTNLGFFISSSGMRKPTNWRR